MSPLLLVKIKNAAELCWDSLDAQERMVLVYVLGWVAASVIVALRRRARAEFKSQILEELRGDADPRPREAV